jgi:HSP20 family protein
MERCFGSLYRTIPLVTEVDQSKVHARFKKGVLAIQLPKSAEAKKQRKRIQIKST